MSRSRKKSPFMPITTARSEKEDKMLANRRHRRINKRLLNQTHDQDALLELRVLSNVWGFDKDGKRMVDPDLQRHLLRK
ncbi:hypothetical protein Pan153_28780 [Gimesia panareensis]|uniref:Uncharacterized protein n=1 Tax=Gimesia panareensis TaxID=2527978 RepID=A0A518FPE2_9PLAN|nr:hypothetical protein [Gimesia panareensis]QDV18221.1 hypothetical protein Pan153_28780 [Gimesia panareensis]